MWDTFALLTLIGGCLSTVSFLIVFYLYWIKRVPALRRHPNSLAVSKCVVECIFCLQYVIVATAGKSAFRESGDNSDNDDNGHRATEFAGVLSFSTQFTLLASELWFLILTVDTHKALTNPFTSYKQNAAYYRLVVYGCSLVTASILVILGPRHYGYSTLGVCWIQTAEQNEFNEVAYLKVIMFYAWILGIYVYCIFTILFVINQRLYEGLPETLNTRKAVVTRGQKYVLGYTLFWVTPIACDFIGWVATAGSGASADNPSKLVATAQDVGPIILSARGVFSLIILLVSNWQDLRESKSSMVGKITEEDAALRPHLNTALRAEILYFTTAGIRHAVLQQIMRSPHIHVDTTIHQGGGGAAAAGAIEAGGSDVDRTEAARNMAANMLDADELVWEDRVEAECSVYVCNMKTDADDRSSAGTNEDSDPLAEQVRPAGKKGLRHPAMENVHGNGSGGDAEEEGIRPSMSLWDYEAIQRESVQVEIKTALKAQVEQDLDMGTVDPFAGPARTRPATLEDDVDVDAYDEEAASPRSGGPAHADERHGGSDEEQPSDKLMQNMDVGNVGARSVSSGAGGVQGGHGVEMSSRSGGANLGVDDGESNRPELDRPGKSGARAADRSHHTQTSLDSFDRVRASDEGAIASSSSPSRGARKPHTHKSRATSSRRVDNDDHRAVAALRKRIASVSDRLRERRNRVKHLNDIEFRDYMPDMFAQLRALAGIDPWKYAESLQRTTKERFSEGKSGAFLYFSADQKYIVKTTEESELRQLLDLLPAYLAHLLANPNSLICRYVGAHSLTIYNKQILFVVMTNVFSANAQLHERYDLKGSWVSRNAPPGDRKKKNPCLKDNDLNHKIHLRVSAARALSEQLLRDSTFLCDHNLMDYSLLIGVVESRFEITEREDDGTRRSQGGEGDPSTDVFGRDADGAMRASVISGPGMYYAGIIDVLQEWNLEKKLERFFKVYIQLKDGDGISAIPPEPYATRFIQRAVRDVFDGADTTDDDYFLPKKRRMESVDDEETVRRGLDRRFSALPITSVQNPISS